MTAVLAIVVIGIGISLVAITYVQLLYYDSLRVRPRDRDVLELFKSKIQPRIGVTGDRGVLTFSIIKHTAILLLGIVFLIHPMLNPRRDAAATGLAILEACLGAWSAMLVSTYIAPHILFRRSGGQWVLPLTPVLRLLCILARPLVALFAIFQTLSDLTENGESAEEEPTPAENIEALITAGTEEGLIEESDRELIQSVVAFGDKTVREVMTPRPSMVSIDANKSLEDLRQLAINEQYSRIPVYEGTIDRVIGFVHVRDMFELDEEDRKRRVIREIVRPIRFVPETKPVNDLLREMQADRAHMAIAVDEYGNTAGLATLEDLVEEVFGEIRDEHEPGLDVNPDGDGRYLLSGNFGLDRLQELLDFHPTTQPESTTVGGLLMEWLGRVPQPGESVEREGIKIEVLAGNDLRVEQVRVSRTETANHV